MEEVEDRCPNVEDALAWAETEVELVLAAEIYRLRRLNEQLRENYSLRQELEEANWGVRFSLQVVDTAGLYALASSESLALRRKNRH